ncbi:MAG: aminoacyl-tRNA hydrolase [Candidatus Hydrogenedentes bacterium]|nr:aminoacyl-tRNA hydrolase [Candidatus Hydrogenedentota bacterium]MBI3119956.1 aminoacyl-tRNA hydrolase [Candidatus Hydrogenedentota bacterium]
MKIIVGLGNPGPQYRNTRHNLGFVALDALAAKLETAFDKEKHQGLLATAKHAGERLLLVKPMTFMNRSGDCVALVAKNKVDTPADLLVVTDDVNLPVGKVRLRAGGSAGGHNGLKSLIERLGTQEFPRLRMGVGDNRADAGLADYVLARFHPEERDAVRAMVETSVEAALCWVSEGLERAMNRYSR